MKALLLAVLLCQAPDAPIVAPDVVVLKVAQPAPFDGVLLSDSRAIEQAQRVVSAETERDALKASHIGLPLIIGAVVGALLVGGAVGYGVARLKR